MGVGVGVGVESSFLVFPEPDVLEPLPLPASVFPESFLSVFVWLLPEPLPLFLSVSVLPVSFLLPESLLSLEPLFLLLLSVFPESPLAFESFFVSESEESSVLPEPFALF